MTLVALEVLHVSFHRFWEAARAFGPHHLRRLAAAYSESATEAVPMSTGRSSLRALVSSSRSVRIV